MHLWSKVSQNFYLGSQNLFERILNITRVFAVRMYLLSFLCLNFLLWLVVYSISSQSKDELIVLHYNIDFGVNLIGPVHKVYVLPAIGLLIIIINFFIVLNAARARSFGFIMHILLFTPILVHLFLLTAAVSIYLINFY